MSQICDNGPVRVKKVWERYNKEPKDMVLGRVHLPKPFSSLNKSDQHIWFCFVAAAIVESDSLEFCLV